MDKVNKLIIIILLIGFGLVIVVDVVLLLIKNVSATTILLLDPRDNDSLTSCDDEICIKDLKIAAMDETLKLNNVTSLLVFPKP